MSPAPPDSNQCVIEQQRLAKVSQSKYGVTPGTCGTFLSYDFINSATGRLIQRGVAALIVEQKCAVQKDPSVIKTGCPLASRRTGQCFVNNVCLSFIWEYKELDLAVLHKQHIPNIIKTENKNKSFQIQFIGTIISIYLNVLRGLTGCLDHRDMLHNEVMNVISFLTV